MVMGAEENARGWWPKSRDVAIKIVRKPHAAAQETQMKLLKSSTQLRMSIHRPFLPVLVTGLLALLPAVAYGGIITAADGVQQFTFSGISSGGTASAKLTFKIVESGGSSTLIVGVHNTSPTVLNAGSGVNSPGITGFGFDLAQLNSSGGIINANPAFTDWKLTAHQQTSAGSVLVILGDNDPATGSSSTPADLSRWSISQPGTMGGITMDLLTTSGNGQNALYNPLVVSGQAASPFYTYAELTLEFDGMTNLGLEWEIDVTSPIKEYSPFVRMQNVGAGGGGSLKLQPQGPPVLVPPESPPITPLPEPVSVAIWGTALAIAGLGSHRFRKMSTKVVRRA
jgi:hypothetical protein